MRSCISAGVSRCMQALIQSGALASVCVCVCECVFVCLRTILLPHYPTVSSSPALMRSLTVTVLIKVKPRPTNRNTHTHTSIHTPSHTSQNHTVHVCVYVCVCVCVRAHTAGFCIYGFIAHKKRDKSEQTMGWSPEGSHMISFIEKMWV